jgi:hypothetical protein
VYQSFSFAGLNLEAGNYMHLHGHSMTPSGNPVTGNNNGYLFIEFFDANWSQLAKYTSNVVDASATTDMWHELMVSGMVPEGTVNINAGCVLWQGPEADAGAVYFDNVVMMISTDVLSSDEDEIVTPKEFALLGNYPNPFNPTTKIRFSNDRSSNVKVTVYSLKGEKIATIMKQQVNAGTYDVSWNGKSTNGKVVPSGMYLYDVESDGRRLQGKMLFLK